MADSTAAPLAPGSTLGILGGGQLGRMTALAAARLGYRCHVFCDDPDDPAAQVCATNTVAGFTDAPALDRFAAAVDVVTLEWENVPVAALKRLDRRVPVRPGPWVLEVTQDRAMEKSFINGAGLATAPWHPVADAADAARAVAELGVPAVLKARRFGYDGKAQTLIRRREDAVAAWHQIGAVDAVMEGFIDFLCEISVIVARSPSGAMLSFPAVENQHANHILKRSLVPARVPAETAVAARAAAEALATALRVDGLLTVELFVTRDGTVLVNELAPRPHNSGHWSLDACATSQFEQLVRAICGLPLGAVELLWPAAMDNLLGEEATDWRRLFADPTARVHLYGKRESRPGRKMGHVTRKCALDTADALGTDQLSMVSPMVWADPDAPASSGTSSCTTRSR